MIRTDRPTTAAALLLLLAACSASQDAGLSTHVATIDTLPGGIVRVTNTGPTLWADTNGWRLVEERIVQPEEGSPGEFSDVTKLVADDADKLFVMQIMPTTIKAFDAEGRFVRDIGQEGNGPGEFPDGMLAIVGDTLLVQDPNNQRLTAFLTDGTLIGMAPSQCCNFTSRLPSFDDGTILIMGPPPTDAVGARVAYYRTHADGSVVDTFLRPAPPPVDRSATTWTAFRQTPTGQADISVGIPGQPEDISVWRGDGSMVVGNTGRYLLAIRRGFGDTLRLVAADAPRLLRTDAERRTLLDSAIANQGPVWRDGLRAVAGLDQVPVNRPVWSSMMVDREGRIWVGLPGTGTDVAILDVFSADGVLLGKVPAPHPSILNGYWTHDRVFVRDADQLGRPMVRVYRLVTSIR